MSSHPSGLRFSPFASPSVVVQNNNTTTTASSSSSHNNSSVIIKGLQQKAQQQTAPNLSSLAATRTANPDSINSGSSDEDSSRPMEDRYVLRQAQPLSNNVGDLPSGRYAAAAAAAASNRSMSEARNVAAYGSAMGPQKGTTNSNRNSLKEANSNRSSMDVSTCSYNTLIIHNNDDLYNSGTAADFSSLLNNAKKDRPRSFGSDQVIKEISEIPDDYLNQNSVLKQLVKEMKLPNRTSNTSGMSDSATVTEGNNKPPPSYGQEKNKWRNCSASKDDGKATTDRAAVDEEEEDDDEDDESGDQSGLSKLKSKSQPDLSRIIDIDLETIEALMKDNVLLKQQLNNCYMKVAKTKKVSCLFPLDPC